ncbi:NDP-sugar synthase [Kitasatospora sp. NPDC057542]|uniref:nucleotidyltransferase family protein n=1 Tax=Streptomycetaceae TaxID=2062 RepID=UPI001CCF8BD0|nr:nucleotidyltransferase family protein [Streptomyces sp. LS1784]
MWLPEVLPRIRQAVVLAGGRGRRLAPYTDLCPKAMVEVNGAPLLRHQIEWFAGAGVETVVVSAGYRSQVITDYVRTASLPVCTTVVVEDAARGRGGGLKLAARALPAPQEPWFAVYGDIWADFPLTALGAHHLRCGALATVALVPPRLPRGTVVCDAVGRVAELAAPPPAACTVNGGVYVFAPGVVPLLPDQGDHADTTLPYLVRLRQLAGYRVGGFWCAVNTLSDLRELRACVAAPARSERSRQPAAVKGADPAAR